MFESLVLSGNSFSLIKKKQKNNAINTDNILKNMMGFA